MARTLIGFSGTQEDYVVVDGTPQEVNDALATSNRSASGLCQLKQAHGQQGPIFVNPDRVAYVQAASNS